MDTLEANGIAALLRLSRIEGLGAVGLKRLASAFPSAQAVFEASPRAWRACELPDRLYRALEAAARVDVSADIESVERSGGWAIGIFDGGYPELLRQIHDPPPVLYGKGVRRALDAACVAVVGARRATRYGLEHGYRLARGLAESGFAVVSGLAVGIDAMAHRGALDGGGTSIAVLGSGVSNVYPSAHRTLADRLCAGGALVSELHPRAAADKVNFPRRNRIISGLCRAIVILEAREDSGSLITAHEGAEQGRDIFVVPGPAGGANRGGHRLLEQGALWAEDATDVVRVLQPAETPPAPPREAEEIPDVWAPVWRVLGTEPVHVDSIIEGSGLRSSDVLGILLQLEINGWARQQSGKFFVRAR